MNSPSGGPQWQVDIPSLSQLVVSAGSYGLKQLALAGVDVHSIGCLLMIAELVPASMEFRRGLNRAREKQRSESPWVYAMIEIGAGTNFLADQLLKTRAGENVLALLSAVIPVMSEEACTRLLSLLFDTNKVNPENTPGFGQLKSIRNALLTFCKKVGVGEKIIQFNVLFESLIAGDNPSEGNDPYTSIPSEQNISQLMQMLHKVSTSSNHVLVYHGFLGAPWLATYASHVLGLKTCALSDGGVVAITGLYEQAKVVLDLTKPDGKCELYLLGELQEFITIKATSGDSRESWAVDCTAINFWETNHPGLKLDKPLLYRDLSVFVAMETFNSIPLLLRKIYSKSSHKDNDGFQLLLVDRIDDLRRKTLGILRTLGFQPLDIEEYSFVEGGSETSQRHCEGVRRRNNEPTRTRMPNDPLPSTFSSCRRPDLGLSLRHRLPHFSEQFKALDDYAQSGVCRTLHCAITFATNMVISDWGVSCCSMSIRQFKSQTMWISSYNILSLERYVIEAMSLTSGIGTDSLKRVWHEDWAAVDLGGVIAIRNTIYTRSLQEIGTNLLLFKCGSIKVDNELCHEIRAETSTKRASDIGFHSWTYRDQGPIEKKLCSQYYKPTNVVHNIAFRAMCRVVNGTGWLRVECNIEESQNWASVCLVQIAHRIPELLLTTPCDHHYYSPCWLGAFSMGIGGYRFIEAWFSGFFPHQDLLYADLHIIGPKGSICKYQLVDRNSAGQWLACQTNKDCPIILQRHTCLDCTLRRLAKDLSRRKLERFEFDIVAGLTEGEELPEKPLCPDSRLQQRAESAETDEKKKGSWKDKLRGLRRTAPER
ncbi:hypothetical protein MMC08_002954 [Hypocenomyce scalaris]|nr:hypothetical protein [Hypocenomyce scalaris]